MVGAVCGCEGEVEEVVAGALGEGEDGDDGGEEEVRQREEMERHDCREDACWAKRESKTR